MGRSTTSAAGRTHRESPHERHHPLVRHPRRGRRQPRPAHRRCRPRHRFRDALADGVLAAFPPHRPAPQPRVGPARLPRHPHRDRRRRPLHGTRLAGRHHSLFLLVPTPVAGSGRGRDLSAARDRRDQSASSVLRSIRLAGGALADLLVVAGCGDPRHRTRPRPALRMDARDRGGVQRRRGGRGRLARDRHSAYGVAAAPDPFPARPEMELIASAPGTERLAAHRQRLGPLPALPSGELIAQLEASGLLGRGGAGFPVGRKWRAVAERAAGDAVVLANGAEGEPLSFKDRSLMAARPHLVIDGALLAARAVGANDIIFYVGGEHATAQAALRQALAERPGDVRRRTRIVTAPAGYVSGEESAAVHYVNAGDARPWLRGGYFGGWADLPEQCGLPLDAPSMRARGLALGCGVVHFLPAGTCGVEATARLMTYLASQSARQCGPCVFGLSAIAGATQRLAAQSPQPGDLDRIVRWSGQLTGRGACHHPDGAATLLQSALEVFADDFAGHQRRRCLTISEPERVAVA